MATYPNDATISPLVAFSVMGTSTYNNTSTEVTFNLPTTVGFSGEVVAVSDGVTQDITTYYLSNSGNSITFVVAPNSTELVLKTISLPARFRINRTYPAIFTVNYSNTAFTTIDSNNYILNGVQTSFPLAESAFNSINDANSLMVVLTGNVQAYSKFTWPSATFGVNGIDLPVAPADPVDDYANALLEIRSFVSSATVYSRFSDMRDRKPDRGYNITRKYNTTNFTTQNGYERRRLMSRRPIRDYELTYTNITGVEKQAIENFYNTVSGEFETFTFDLSHINNSGTVRARFTGPLEISHIISNGSDLEQNIYTVKFKLMEDFS